jgi:hypothetical protein
MGQITSNTFLGSFLTDICKKNADIKTVVEIGTWDGMGSTECIIHGLANSNKSEIKFISLESDLSMHNNAVKSWENKLPEWAFLIHGRIVDEKDMDSNNLNFDEKNWFQNDIANIKTCENVFEILPNKIDLLVLDGGEFSTESEFKKLANRSKIIVLDDTEVRKGRAIKASVISSPDKYKIIFNLPEIRNGIIAFEII